MDPWIIRPDLSHTSVAKAVLRLSIAASVVGCSNRVSPADRLLLSQVGTVDLGILPVAGSAIVSRLVPGKVPNLITRVDLNHRLMRIIFDSLMGQATLVQPFRDDDLFTLSPEGPSVVKVERRVETATVAPHFIVTSFSPTGQLRFKVRHSYRARHTNSQAVDSVVRLLVEAIARHSRFSHVSDVEHQVRANLFVPTFFPAVTHLLVSPEGSIWLERPDLHGDWQVLSSKGSSVARIRLPPRIRLLAASGSMLLGAYQSTRPSGDSVVLMTFDKEPH